MGIPRKLSLAGAGAGCGGAATATGACSAAGATSIGVSCDILYPLKINIADLNNTGKKYFFANNNF
jgi:hypothetical protein